MDPMADIVAEVRLLAESGDPAALAVAGGLDAWRRSGAIWLEEALGRAPGWRVAWRLRRRDEALRRLALQFPDLSGRALAAELHRVVTRYGACAWRRDRDSGHRPDGVNGLAFDALIHGAMQRCQHLRKTVLGDGGDRNPPPKAHAARYEIWTMPCLALRRERPHPMNSWHSRPSAPGAMLPLPTRGPRPRSRRPMMKLSGSASCRRAWALLLLQRP